MKNQSSLLMNNGATFSNEHFRMTKLIQRFDCFLILIQVKQTYSVLHNGSQVLQEWAYSFTQNQEGYNHVS